MHNGKDKSAHLPVSMFCFRHYSTFFHEHLLRGHTPKVFAGINFRTNIPVNYNIR
jgi:hypothetical protein